MPQSPERPTVYLPDNCQVQVDIKHLYMRYSACYVAGARFVIEEVLQNYAKVIENSKLKPELAMANFLSDVLVRLQKNAAKKYCSTKDTV